MSEYYKPLTPAFRDEINSSIDKQIRELNTCQSNIYVNMQKTSLGMVKKLINGLPDGYPIPIEDTRR